MGMVGDEGLVRWGRFVENFRQILGKILISMISGRGISYHAFRPIAVYC